MRTTQVHEHAVLTGNWNDFDFNYLGSIGGVHR
jgi:hypothetical protein